MLNTERVCAWIFILGFMFLLPSFWLIKFADELMAFSFSCVALLDCIVNGNWKRYRLLWIVICILLFYVIYSIAFQSHNTGPFILMDAVIEIKSYLSFIILLSVGVTFTPLEKRIIKKTALINCLIVSILLLAGEDILCLFIFHLAFAGIGIMTSLILYLYCSIDENGKITQNDIRTICIFLVIGLLCTRSKYFGECVLFIFFLFVYKPGMLKYFSTKQIFIVATTMALVIVVAWKKIEFYFITGGNDTFDPELVESFARPVLYATGALILIDYFPFGSGLASFATYPSQISYSNIYYEYGINNVFGLSPQRPDFICDAYYPSLAQFGFVGIAIFTYLWIYIYRHIRLFIRLNPLKYKYQFICGSMSIFFILIECVAGTAFTLSCGVLILGFLGILVAQTNPNSFQKDALEINEYAEKSCNKRKI